MTKKPRRLKVASKRNSDCGVPLDQLDWSNWWTDIVGQVVYLHVQHTDKSDGAVHRVWYKHADYPRLMLRDGVLYWLVDK